MMLEKKYEALLARTLQSGVSEPGRPLTNEITAEPGGIRLCFELLSLAAAIDRDCAARLSPHRLSEGKFLLLVLLRDRAEGLSPHELADASGVTRATITGLLDGLEKDGLVTRRPAYDDRRKLLVSLTVSGKTLVETLFVEHAEWISSLLSGLDQSERCLLSKLLVKVRTKTGAATVSAGLPDN